MRAGLGLALIALAGLAAGCGGGSSGQVGSAFAPRHSPPPDARYGGELRVLSAGDIDFLDPGSAAYQFTLILDFATQRALMGWPPGVRTEPVPDLAAGPPRISHGGRRLEFRIRPGIRYSPPVGREVRAEDFEYAIERGLLPGVANSYGKAYLGSLVGYARAEREATENPERAPDIAGVSAPSPGRLVLRFNRPTATAAMQVLSLPLGAPVPEEYAARFDRRTPSAYGQHVVGTGPYMIDNDADGDITGYQPGQQIRLVRNPNWNPATDYRPAFVDAVTFAQGYSNTVSASRRIVSGSSEVNGDFGPDSSVLEEVVRDHPDQLTIAPGGGVLYVALNTTIPPLDDVDVRRAVAAATDRKAMQLARGGPLTGPIATHFIPPGLPGFEEAGGYAGPGFPFFSDPSGDPAIAARYMKRAGYAGGRYEGDARLELVADTSATGRKVAAVVLDAFETVGIPVDATFVSRDVMYTEFCNLPSARIAVCPGVGWIKEFNDPQTVLDSPFSGDRIQPVNNPNLSQFDDPVTNRMIDEARAVEGRAARNRAWAAIDRRVTSLVPAIPWQWNSSAIIASKDVNAVINAFNAATDVSFTSLEGATRDSIGCEHAPAASGC